MSIEIDFSELESINIYEKKKKYEKGFIDSLVEQASFEDVLNYYNLEIKPQRNGEFLVFCPFHNDTKNPNCFINPSKNAYFCFSCGEKGTILNFVFSMEKNVGNTSFSDSVYKLSKIAGMEDTDAGDILDMQIDNYGRSKKNHNDNTPQILGMKMDVFNITVSSMFGEYLMQYPNDIDYIESIYKKMDICINENNIKKLTDLFKKVSKIIKKRKLEQNSYGE